MFDYNNVNIEYGTLIGFTAPDEGPVYRPARDEDERWGLYHPKKNRCNGATLEIPESIRGIGDGAFENCFALTGISIPESVTWIGARAFRSCNNLPEIAFPSHLKEIGKEAFAFCSGLTKLDVPDSVETIGDCAFENCKNLVEIRLPDALSRQVKRIFGEDAERMFYDVRRGKLKVNARLSAALTGIIKAKWYAAVEKLIDAEDCEKMKQYLALWEDRPVSAERLDEAIEQAQQKQKTDMMALLMEYKHQHYTPERQQAQRQREEERALGLRPPTVAEWQKVYAYRTEEDGIVIKRYKGAEQMIEVPAVIGRKPVIAIEGWSPYSYRDGSDQPYWIVLPEGLREIRKKAFYNCSQIKDIVLPKTLAEIGEEAFNGCNSLEKVVIPDGVTRVQRHVFYRCKKLSSVSIPESVREIWWEAFDECESLKELILPGKVTSIHTGYWYGGQYEKISVLVPKGSITEETVKRNNIPYRTM